MRERERKALRYFSVHVHSDASSLPFLCRVFVCVCVCVCACERERERERKRESV